MGVVEVRDSRFLPVDRNEPHSPARVGLPQEREADLPDAARFGSDSDRNV